MGLLLLRVAIHAAGSVNGEYHRDTMVSLLTSPLETREILFAKWLAQCTRGRAGWVWLGAIWLLGVVTGGLHPVGVPLTAAAFLAYAGFVAAVGLWFSTLQQQPHRVGLDVLTVLLCTVHWLGFLLFITFYPYQFFSNDPTVPLVACFHALALTPPGGLAFLPFSWGEVRSAFGESAEPWWSWALFGFGMFGPLFWLLAGWGVFGLTHRRFRRQTNRDAAGPEKRDKLTERCPATSPTRKL
jgi:ABC-type Na+ efflux pump permease subunit